MTPSLTPFCRAAAIIASQSSRLAASGFSTRTWAPALAASIAGRACRGCGVQMKTDATSHSLIMVGTSV